MAVDIEFPDADWPDWERYWKSKGFFTALVRATDGKRFNLLFYEPQRLHTDLGNFLTTTGKSYFADPGLVAIPEISRDVMLRAADELERDGYFEALKPV